MENAEKKEAEEKKEELKPVDPNHERPGFHGPPSGLSAFGLDDDILNHEDGYTEESTDAQGHHIKKTLHKGNGFSSV